MRAINATEVERARSSVCPDATFEAVYREHFEFAWASLRHLGVPEFQVDDAVQEVFIVVHRRLPEFDWGASIRTWVFAIAKRVAARQRRTSSRAIRKNAAVAKEAPHAAPDLLDEAVARTEAGVILFDFLDSLDDDKREVFILANLEGLRGPEIAEAIGIPVNTVYSRLRVAKEHFEKRCERLRARDEHVLRDGRAQSRPPAQAQQRAWLMLAPQLGLASKTGGTVASVLAMSAQIKVFAATVVIGAGLVVGARAIAPESTPPETPPIVAVAAGPEDADRPRAPRPNKDRPAPTIEAIEPARDPPDLQRPTPAEPSKVQPPAPPPPPDDPSPALRLGREAKLLGHIKSALVRKDLQAALGHIQTHAREFPTGQLAADRNAYHAITLCDLGRPREGRGVAKLYLAQNPNPALADQIRTACGV